MHSPTQTLRDPDSTGLKELIGFSRDILTSQASFLQVASKVIKASGLRNRITNGQTLCIQSRYRLCYPAHKEDCSER